MYILSNLDPSELETLRQFEAEQGVKVLAFEEVDSPAPARLDDSALTALQQLEQKLGHTLIAYR